MVKGKGLNPNALSDAGQEMASSVYDTGRRGMPLACCDCVQCFGYCLPVVDRDPINRTVYRSQVDRVRRVGLEHVLQHGNPDDPAYNPFDYEE